MEKLWLVLRGKVDIGYAEIREIIKKLKDESRMITPIYSM
ncbi:hypothetical protein M2150_002949 [Lachnospiraceae bacterium PM6-15]